MTIHINGKKCTTQEEQTILTAARENGIFIPALCFGEGLAPGGSCGICVVEVEGDTRLLRACATAVRDGMAVSTESERVLAARKSLLELAISAHSGDCVAPCKLACPAESDCQGFVALVAAGKFREAVELMKDAHPFPASVARICPRPCESECRRKLADEPINIAGVKQFAADFILSSPDIPSVAQPTGKSVAIIGGGPGGLTAAFFLKKAGHDVEILEAMPENGGLLRYGIPEYRLPKAVLDAEIDVLSKMGIRFSNNTELGRDVTLEALQASRDAVIIATGAGVSKPIWCDGEDAEGVFGGIDFLKAVAENSPPKIGSRVVVIGGSNTAMDAARTALRLGAEAIVAYRRTRDEMPAEKIEVEEAIAEGVQFSFLTAPLEILTENGRATGIKLQKMRLGEPDASGRRAPVPIEGGEETIEASAIIAAIGQDTTIEGLNPLENFKIDENFRTALPGVYAIGDATGKSSYAIDAIAHGRKVAEIVNADCISISEQLPKILVRTDSTSVDVTEVESAPRQNAPHFVHADVRGDFGAVQGGLSAAEAQAEAKRCLSCGCADFFDCKLLKLANIYGADTKKYPAAYHKKPHHKIDRSNFFFHRDMNKCVLCGLCVGVCEKESLSAVNRGFDTKISAAFGEKLQNRDECALCGNCVARCPVGALTEVSPLPKQLVAREKTTATTCTICGNGCQMRLATAAGAILRTLPADGKILCDKGRFGFLNFGERLTVPLVKKGDILRKASLPEAAKLLRERLNVLKAQYGAEAIGIAVSPAYTSEDLAALKSYAANLGTPHIFTFSDLADEKKTHSNTAGLKNLGISAEREVFLQKIKDGEIKGLIAFGDDLPNELTETPLEFLALQAAYASKITAKPARFADIILPAPAFGEVSGSILNEKSGETLAVNPALPPACGFQTRELLYSLK